MMDAKVGDAVHFGPHRKLARLNISSRSYLCTIGFERNQGFLNQAELDLNAAFSTVALAELKPKPTASTAEIREVVEWSDKVNDPEYGGHDHERVVSLFPRVRIYGLEEAREGATWNVFFQACVDECDLGASWVEGKLAYTLRSMCGLDQDRIPYRVLCRSIFDGDKSSFFLALYRCLESLYAYSSSHSLARTLKLDVSWDEIARALEDNLGWHPREEDSLTRLTKFASAVDLREILSELSKLPPPDDFEALSVRASKAIYKLRNSIVHYRPAQHKIEMDAFNWEKICGAMVGIVVDVYEAVFNGRSA